MNKDTKATLIDFVAKAAKRLEDKATVKHRTLYIPSLDENVKIRSITKAEYLDAVAYSDDSFDSDAYAIYMAIVEPNLKELAKELKSQGKINESLEVMDIFETYEIGAIAREVMGLSGLTGDGVKVVDEIKN